MRRRSRLSNPLAGLIVTVLVVAATAAIFDLLPDLRPGQRLDLVVRAAADIRPGSPVRTAGVMVGEVRSVAGEPGTPYARITLELEDAALPVHADATAKIRPRLFLEGNFFVDLSPGSPSARTLGDGATLPVDASTTAVQLDEVLGALRADTRRGLQTTLRELDAGLDAPGTAGSRESVENAEGALRDSVITADALGGARPGDLRRLIASGETVSRALAADPVALRAAVTGASATFSTVGARNRELRAALRELPRTLRLALPSLAAVRTASPSLRRLAAEQDGLRATAAALERLTPLTEELSLLVAPAELGGLAEDLAASTPPVTALLRRSVPLLGQARAAASCTNELLLPWARDKLEDADFPATGPVFQEAVKWLPGVAGESRTGDANGQWFRAQIGAGAESLAFGDGVFAQAFAPMLGANPAKPAGRPPLEPTVACESQQAPDLRSRPGAPPPTVRTDTSTADYRRRAERAQETAVRWLRRSLGRDRIGDGVAPVVTERRP